MFPQKDVEEFTYEELNELEHQLCHHLSLFRDDEKADKLLDKVRELQEVHKQRLLEEQRIIDAPKIREYQFRRGLELGFWSDRDEFDRITLENCYEISEDSKIEEPQIEFV